jgi:carotenoid cleavage dioxygenase
MHCHRYGYHTSADSDAGDMYNMVVGVDYQSGRSETYSFGDRRSHFISEAIFVPRGEDAGENDGYLLTVATDMEDGSSSLAVLDAQNIAAGPVATARLEHRIPVGFHGGWRPAD